MASRRRSRRVIALAVLAVLVGSILPVAPAQRTGPVGEPVEGARYETHDPISVSGDADLADDQPMVPIMEGDDDGVRGGSGTEDDPYVIARWRIPFDPGEGPAIYVEGTTDHLVIEEIIFVPDDPSVSGLNVWLLGAENVTIRDLTLAGAQGLSDEDFVPQVLSPSHVERVTVRNVTVDGNGTIAFSDGRQVRLEGVTLQGWKGYISMATGTYELEDVQVIGHRTDLGGYAGGLISLGRDVDEPEGPCRAMVRDLTVRGARGAGVQAQAGGCRLTVTDADVTSNHWGAWVRDGATARITSSTFRRADEFSWSESGFALENASDIEIEDVTAVGYPKGLTAEDSNFTVRRTGLVSETGGVVVDGSCPRCAIHNSSLWSARNSGPSTVDARWNWWGYSSGPDDNAVKGNVLVEPVLTERPDGVAPLPEDGPGLPLPVWVGILALGGAAVGWGRRHR